jgi:hypothetical protein
MKLGSWSLSAIVADDVAGALKAVGLALALSAVGCAAGDEEAAVTSSDPKCQMVKNGVISDFEDGTAGVKQVQGRTGGWYTYNDKSPGSMQSPPEGAMMVLPARGGACNSRFAFKTSGGGFTKWGAGIGTDLNAVGTVKKTYDASGYTGFIFWFRASRPMKVRVKLQDKNTTPEGGICMPMEKCYDNHGWTFDANVDWTAYQVPFDSLKQEGWGLPASPTLDKSKLYAIQLQTPPDGMPFELWLDHLSFY